MSIEKIERFATETVIHVCEPTRFGEPDRFHRLVLHHDGAQRGKLKTIDSQELATLRAEPLVTVDRIKIDQIGRVVFVNDFDDDCSSATYRAGAHSVRGPFLLAG